jgi:hypothetical protein
MTARRFPAPWSVEELDACFVVRDNDGQKLALMSISRRSPAGDRPRRVKAKSAPEKSRELAEAREQLTEALEQRTATSEVLGVISSSPGELTSVFDTILANALRPCDADTGHVILPARRRPEHAVPPPWSIHLHTVPYSLTVRVHGLGADLFDAASARTAMSRETVE